MMSYKVNNLRESEVTMSHARTPAGTCYRWNENEEQRSNMKRAVLLDTVPFLWVGGEDDEFGIRAQCWRSSPSWGRRLLGSCLRLGRRRQTSVTSPHSDDWQSEIRTTQQQQQQRLLHPASSPVQTAQRVLDWLKATITEIVNSFSSHIPVCI